MLMDDQVNRGVYARAIDALETFFTACLKQRSLDAIPSGKSLIRKAARTVQKVRYSTEIVPGNNLITLARETSLAPSTGRPTHHEAQTKEVLHGNDQTATRQMASTGPS